VSAVPSHPSAPGSYLKEQNELTSGPDLTTTFYNNRQPRVSPGGRGSPQNLLRASLLHFAP